MVCSLLLLLFSLVCYWRTSMLTIGQHVAIQVRPWNTHFGTLKRIGRTGYHIELNGGTIAWYPMNSNIYASNEYMTRNPNPYERRL